jgi:hypothetical protein
MTLAEEVCVFLSKHWNVWNTFKTWMLWHSPSQATQETEIRRIMVLSQPGEKFLRLHLNRKSWVWW